MIDARKKIGTAAAVVSLCAAVGVAGLIGCAPQATPTASTGGSEAPAATTETGTETEAASYDGGNLDKWAEQFPLQYNSYHQSPVKSAMEEGNLRFSNHWIQ